MRALTNEENDGLTKILAGEGLADYILFARTIDGQRMVTESHIEDPAQFARLMVGLFRPAPELVESFGQIVAMASVEVPAEQPTGEVN